MLDDATFLKAARAQFEGAKRLTGTTTMTADHALRLLEMAERAGPPSPDAPKPAQADDLRGVGGRLPVLDGATDDASHQTIQGPIPR